MKNNTPLALVLAAAAALVAGACTGGAAVSADCTQVKTYPDVTAFASCTECHSSTVAGAARQDAPTSIDFDTYAAAVVAADEASREVQFGSMPPGGGLTDDEKLQIVNWAECGTPE